MTAKLVRSTMEKSWSGKASATAHATSRSAAPTGSISAAPALETLPEALGGAPTQTVAQEQPRLHEHVVGGQEVFAAAENLGGAPVASVAAVGRRIPGRRVHEQAQRRARLLPRSAAIASPTMASLRREMSAPPESPRSKTSDGSVRRRRRARSRATRVRTYSAKETPSWAAFWRAWRCNSGSRLTRVLANMMSIQ